MSEQENTSRLLRQAAVGALGAAALMYYGSVTLGRRERRGRATELETGVNSLFGRAREALNANLPFYLYEAEYETLQQLCHRSSKGIQASLSAFLGTLENLQRLSARRELDGQELNTFKRLVGQEYLAFLDALDAA